DLAVFLDRLGLEPPPGLGREVRIAFQDACHLLHGQGVASAPRRLLRQIPGLHLTDIPDSEICCGSAGTYNLDHPETASILGARKARHLMETGAEAAVSGNIGCIMQIRAHLAKLGSTMPCMHWVEILDRSYDGGELRGRQ